MTRGLAEMQTTLLTAALPAFDGRVDHVMVYTLVARRSIDTARPIPVLPIANSLRLPFETTRRHVGALVKRGLCQRDRRGVTLVGSGPEPLPFLATLAHDSLVRFVEDLAAVNALPSFTPTQRCYTWKDGWRAAADLMLAVAEASRSTYHDRVDLALFSTILCANSRPVAREPALARRYVRMQPVPPAELICPLRPRILSERLAIPEATVRRRLERLTEGPVRHLPDGLVVEEDWLTQPGSVATSVATWGNVRRLLLALANHGFPLSDAGSAYLIGRPPDVPLD